jgi:hypothetical protein
MISVRLVFFGQDKGGRKSPPHNDYRSLVQIGNELTSCTIKNLGPEMIFAFDQEFHVSLTLMFPEQYPSSFAFGDEIRLYEGHKVVGKGIVEQPRTPN